MLQLAWPFLRGRRLVQLTWPRGHACPAACHLEWCKARLNKQLARWLFIVDTIQLLSAALRRRPICQIHIADLLAMTNACITKCWRSSFTLEIAQKHRHVRRGVRTHTALESNCRFRLRTLFRHGTSSCHVLEVLMYLASSHWRNINWPLASMLSKRTEMNIYSLNLFSLSVFSISELYNLGHVWIIIRISSNYVKSLSLSRTCPVTYRPTHLLGPVSCCKIRTTVPDKIRLRWDATCQTSCI